MATIQTVAVVVAQAGAEVACHVDAARSHSSVELFQQAKGESETQLSQRLRSRLSALNASGLRVTSATFVAKSGFGTEDVLGAAGLVRGLVALMVAVGANSVRLHASPRDRHAEVALTALTSALAEQLRGTGVSLEADFSRLRADASAPVMVAQPPSAPAQQRVAVA